MVRARALPVVPVGTGTRNPAKEIPTGQPYGAATEQRTALHAVPLPAPSMPVAQPEPVQPDPIAAAAGYNPAGPTLDSPTANPNEPVTAGLASGPGPGPQALNLPSNVSQTANILRTLYANVPAAQNPDFARLVELAEQESWR